MFSFWLPEKWSSSLHIFLHDVIFEEFVDCSIMEKDNFADVQLDKTVLSEESLYQILRYGSKQETKGI